MFKISKGCLYGTYKLEFYQYIREINFYMFLYSVDNITASGAVYALQGRIDECDIDEATWALDIVRLTDSTAVIGDDGKLKPIPLKHKGANYGEYRERSH